MSDMDPGDIAGGGGLQMEPPKPDPTEAATPSANPLQAIRDSLTKAIAPGQEGPSPKELTSLRDALKGMTAADWGSDMGQDMQNDLKSFIEQRQDGMENRQMQMAQEIKDHDPNDQIGFAIKLVGMAIELMGQNSEQAKLNDMQQTMGQGMENKAGGMEMDATSPPKLGM